MNASNILGILAIALVACGLLAFIGAACFGPMLIVGGMAVTAVLNVAIGGIVAAIVGAIFLGV